MGIPNHRITICTSCKHKGETCRLGYELIELLRAAVHAAGDTISEEFEISGAACMVGCAPSCTIAYHSTRKATYLFGGIDTVQDIDDLVSFARQYAVLADGWSSSVDRPGKQRTQTLARVPAMILAVEDSAVRLS